MLLCLGLQFLKQVLSNLISTISVKDKTFGNAAPRKSCGGPAPVVWAAVVQQPFVCGSVPERRTLAKSLPNLRTAKASICHDLPCIFTKQTKILQDRGQLLCMPMRSYDCWWLFSASGIPERQSQRRMNFRNPFTSPSQPKFAGNGYSIQRTSTQHVVKGLVSTARVDVLFPWFLIATDSKIQ